MGATTRLTRRTRAGVAAVAALVTAAAGLVVTAAPVTAAAPTVVSLTFNDGLSSQYRNAAPLLEQNGLDGTFYVASNWVKTFDSNYMRFYELDELYRQGNEIGGMGKDHQDLTATYDTDATADLAYKTDQVCGDFQQLTAWGYHPASFSYPFGVSNAQAQQIVQSCGYLTGRMPGGLAATGPDYAESVPPAQPMALRTANLPGGAITLQSLQDAVTAAGANGGGWLPFAFNRVCSQAESGYSTCMGTPQAIDRDVFSSFLVWLKSQEAEGVTVRTVGEVMGAPHPTLEQRPFVVSLTFDDGLRSQYNLRQIFARHNAHGTFYINSGAVDAGEPGVMTWPQIHDLANAGHDIGGHTSEHVDLLASNTTFDFKWHQTCDDRARLLEQGFNAVSFAFPFGSMNDDTSALARACGYQSARKAGTVTSDGPIFSETIPPTENPWAIRILGTNYNGAVTLEALQLAVNQARAHGGSWLPTLFHEICYAGQPGFSSCMDGYRPISDTTIDQFLTWLETLSGQNVSVKTITDVIGGGQTAPRVAVSGPAAGATVNAAQPVLSGTATGSSSVSVSVYDGPYSMGTPLATLTAPVTNGSWSVQPASPLPSGTYTVQVAQNSGTVGTSVPRTFIVNASGPADTTAPAPTVTSPTSGSTVRTPTPTLAGAAGTAAGDDTAVTVRVYSGSTAAGTPAQTTTVPVGAGGTWSTSANALADGPWTVTVTQGDAAGNLATSPATTFNIDTTVVDSTPPVVAVTAPASGATVTTSTPTVSGTGGTAAGDTNQVTLRISPSSPAQGEVQNLQATVGTDGSWTATPAALADGTWTVQATQVDAAGNIGTSTAVTFTVNTQPADTTAPAVTITSPVTGSSISSTSLTASGAAGTQQGDAATVTLDVFAGSAATGTPVRTTTAAVTSGSWTTTLTGLAAGTYTLRARQSDAAGNVGTSGLVTVTMSAPPRITGVNPANLGQGASAVTVRVNGSGFLAGATVAIGGTGVTSTVTARTATRVTLSVSVAGDAPTGARSVTVTNPNGSTVTCATCLTIVAGPTLTSVSPATIRRGRDTTVTLTGTGFTNQTDVTVSGAGVTVRSTTRLSATRMTAVLRVTAGAALTTRSVTVTQGNNFGSFTLANGVTVVT
ncbi:polysaccharide deacetylase family protein [Nocardioides iriomotensis]|uniref:NodB homology domain-containing protein n=1 Tax=Nocardioides iriomotensis TaxID=715784 RepID=A0A4Q5JA62_9ACTN|nr:polysaccharide deacetylase family protein [Nocardioides iriomotensis]RYU15642.1 hypothetical protein ETU37_00545 [Nocardioides iriomotensis]